MDYKEAIARAIMACGGRVGPGHGDGGWRRSSGEALHGAGAYRTRTAGTGGGSALLGWWWSYGSGAGVARRELCAAMATAELRELGGCCCEEERPRRSKWGHGTARADTGGVKAAPRRVVACAVYALATRGRRRGHAAFALCRWSAIEANVPDLIQFIRNAMAA